MKRPVWLFSLDTERFSAVPMTTGRLKAYYARYGARSATTDIRLVHFANREEVASWLSTHWLEKSWLERFMPRTELGRARAAAKRDMRPVAGFSFYTWNADVFLEAIRVMRARCPDILIVAGGPHVQRAQDFLIDDGIDVVVLGEGEITFQELLDCDSPSKFTTINGLALLTNGKVVETPRRERCLDLDSLPSALDVVPLTDSQGEPLYSRVAYESSRGCPFRCSFCEWGTGATGTKMVQHSVARVRSDFERLIAAGMQDIWLCDSNFGALPDDLDKARIIVELRQRTGRPSTFATSWSKNHNARVQEIVLMLQRNGLLQQYVLALQTLTPLALQLSNRKNLKSNRYEPIVKDMVDNDVPVSAELIWGLPGDNLPDFEANLDRLTAVFPNLNIYGYTLLPGTEFFERRDEYAVQTIPVAGYGKAKGEYVVACHTFDREQGVEGYFLITAHLLLVRGHIMPLTARYLALTGCAPVSAFLRRSLRDLATTFSADIAQANPSDRMALYEAREELYIIVLQSHERAFRRLRASAAAFFSEYGVGPRHVAEALAILELDAACCPRAHKFELTAEFDFDARLVWERLTRMELPPNAAFASGALSLRIEHPGGAGSVLTDPDGGSWFQGRLAQPPRERARIALPLVSHVATPS